jgi:hypothetical protein
VSAWCVRSSAMQARAQSWYSSSIVLRAPVGETGLLMHRLEVLIRCHALSLTPFMAVWQSAPILCSLATISAGRCGFAHTCSAILRLALSEHGR